MILQISFTLHAEKEESNQNILNKILFILQYYNIENNIPYYSRSTLVANVSRKFRRIDNRFIDLINTISQFDEICDLHLLL